jgi:nucleoid-associated protein YgaU
VLIWSAIFGTLDVTASSPAALQRPSHVIRPEHVIHPHVISQPTREAPAKVVTVASRMTLWSIARQYCGNGIYYKKIMNANGIRTWMIHPGERIKIACN